jgi:hypothetical protein
MLSLLLAIAIWFLIKGYLSEPVKSDNQGKIPKAIPVKEGG